MSRSFHLGPLARIPAGEGRTFDVGGVRVAVFRTYGDAVFATQADCPHRAGPLADGMVGGTILMCPLHDWTFDLTTGEPLSGVCGIRTYPVRVDGDGIVTLALD
jgi:nitrite reductase (NADH) small subunit